MNVGYHYHVPALVGPDAKVCIPAHHGLFIEQLANRLGTITFFGHTTQSTGNEDFELSEPQVRFVDLGPIRRFPIRTFAPLDEMRRFRRHSPTLDAMLIRGPTPLLPAMIRSCGELPVVVHLVGDYTNWESRAEWPRWRNLAMKWTMHAYDALQRIATRRVLVLANNEVVADKARRSADNVDVVFTSSLPEGQIATAPHTWDHGLGRTRPVRLLYTGRIVKEKGLFETVDALSVLKDRGINAIFRLVGWESARDPTIETLLNYASRRGQTVEYLGYRAAGPELAAAYADADIFVIPSYYEGFPHTIFEAMGAGLPVIASDVGGIGRWLSDKDNALLISPKNHVELAEAVGLLVDDGDVWRRVAERGWLWSKDHTEERSCELLAEHIKRWRDRVDVR